ncbi:hypothetical protein [Nocardia sp. CA-119907]|uniref:hypothetical protein n=1 Tax=unclassified Nocardia TaxID=2637762 RepID=UPI003D99ADC2
MRDVLATVSAHRLGIISNPGNDPTARTRAAAALAATFGDIFSDNLVHWGDKTSRTIFDAAAAAAGGPGNCVFIGEDPSERAMARRSGMRTAPHPVFAPAAVRGDTVLWAKIHVDENRTLAQLRGIADATEIVPVRVASDRLVLAMVTERGAHAARDAGFDVDLESEVGDTAVFLVRDDRPISPPAGLETDATDVPSPHTPSSPATRTH